MDIHDEEKSAHAEITSPFISHTDLEYHNFGTFTSKFTWRFCSKV